MTDEQMLKLLALPNWTYTLPIGVYNWALGNGDWSMHYYCGDNRLSNRIVTVMHNQFDGELSHCFNSIIIDKVLKIKDELDLQITKARMEKIEKFLAEHLP